MFKLEFYKIIFFFAVEKNSLRKMVQGEHILHKYFHLTLFLGLQASCLAQLFVSFLLLDSCQQLMFSDKIHLIFPQLFVHTLRFLHQLNKTSSVEYLESSLAWLLQNLTDGLRMLLLSEDLLFAWLWYDASALLMLSCQNTGVVLFCTIRNKESVCWKFFSGSVDMLVPFVTLVLKRFLF